MSIKKYDYLLLELREIRELPFMTILEKVHMVFTHQCPLVISNQYLSLTLWKKKVSLLKYVENITFSLQEYDQTQMHYFPENPEWFCLLRGVCVYVCTCISVYIRARVCVCYLKLFRGSEISNENLH